MKTSKLQAKSMTCDLQKFTLFYLFFQMINFFYISVATFKRVQFYGEKNNIISYVQ